MSANEEAPGGAAGPGNVEAGASTNSGIIRPETEEQIPKSLRALRRWLAWRPVPQADGSMKKTPTGEWRDPARWLTYDEARARAPKTGGVGLVLGQLPDGPRLGGVDLDGCRDPEKGALTDWAREWVTAFRSYAEVSPSGTGVKIFALGATPKLPRHVWKMPGEPVRGKRPQLEAYVDDGRWFAVTGDRLPDAPAEVANSGAWLDLYHRLEAAAAETGSAGGFAEPVVGTIGAGGRNVALTRIAGKCRDFGCGARGIYAMLAAENAERCDPPLSDGEVRGIVKSVMRYPVGKAWWAVGEAEDAAFAESQSAEAQAEAFARWAGLS